MGDWQITATTIYCNEVGDEVTVMVSGDWSVACTGFIRTSKVKGRTSCEGLDCHQVTGYVAKLKAEESAGVE